MSAKRTLLWLHSKIPVKRYALCKLLTIALTTSITWFTLMFIDSSDVLHTFSSHVTISKSVPSSASSTPTEKARESSELLQATMLSLQSNAAQIAFDIGPFDNPPALIADYIVADKPGATYFNFKGNLFGEEKKRKIKTPEKRVLVFLQDITKKEKIFTNFLLELRFDYQLTNVSLPIPVLMRYETPMFSLIIFQDYNSYLTFPPSKRAYLDQYCINNKVSILAFTESTRSAELEYFSGIGLKLQHRMKLQKFKMNPDSKIWHTARPEVIYEDPLPTSSWTVFITMHQTFKPLAFSTVAPDWTGSGTDIQRSEFGAVVGIHDIGKW